MNTLLKWTAGCIILVLVLTLASCNDDDSSNPTQDGNKYLVGAEFGVRPNQEGYYLTTDNIQSGSISFVGKGREGFSSLSVSVDGYLYIINNSEKLIEKLELTKDGPVKVSEISSSVLTPSGFFRYIHYTGDGQLFLTNFPNDERQAPYAIINLDNFTAEKFGFLEIPNAKGGKQALWVNALVEGDKIYFSSQYGDSETWSQFPDSLITIKFDYPSLTNPEMLVSTASAGTTAGYRTNGTFKVENGDIYQYNLNSVQWNGTDELSDKPTVFVRIKDGQYDSYVFDVSAEFDEPIAIWNAWYAGNNIVYANVVREADIPTEDDLLKNTGTLVEINLATKAITELNIPKAPFRDIMSLNCIEDGKFHIPVSIHEGEAHIYEITIGGGADGFKKGAKLDGSNVYVNSLFKNF